MQRIVISGRPGIELPENILELLGQIVAKQNSVTDVIDETESVPVLSDEPEDPEVTIETLQARILYLEAELEEHKRSVDGVLEALAPLGTSAAPSVDSDAPQTVSGPVAPDYEAAREGARNFLAGSKVVNTPTAFTPMTPIPGSSWYLTPTGWVVGKQ
jgi:hypothetical protein